MAKKTSNKRKYIDIAFIALIGICVVLVLVYQVQSALDVVQPEPEPTQPPQTNRPSNGFVPPTRGPEDAIRRLPATATPEGEPQ